MDNIIHKIEDICITETHVYAEQNIVPEQRYEEGILAGRNEMAVAILYIINHLKKIEDEKQEIEYLGSLNDYLNGVRLIDNL